MSMYDKNISQEKLKSLEFAEAAREMEWKEPSFALKLFHGSVDFKIVRRRPRHDEVRHGGARQVQDLQPIALGVDLEPDVQGELALRPGWPSMFRAYWQEPERYKKCFADGLCDIGIG